MTGPNGTGSNGFEQNSVEARLAMVEMALRPNGVLFELAQAGLATPEGSAAYDLTPTEAAEILLPTPDGELDPRFELLDNTKAAITEAANQRADQILAFAEQLGMRQPESISDANVSKIDAHNAIWVVGGAANRTSVVRRQLAIDAMRTVYPQGVGDKYLYQFASSRPISKHRADGSGNPEHKVALEIAGDFLPDTDITEYDVSLASALQADYRIDTQVYRTRDQASVYLTKAGNYPTIHLICPPETAVPKDKSGLEAGLTVLDNLVLIVDEKQHAQVVTSTNGQYRPKEQRQVARWAANHDVELQPTVVLGDEAGYQVEHNDQTYTTGERKPMAYVLEAIVLSRMPIHKD